MSQKSRVQSETHQSGFLIQSAFVLARSASIKTLLVRASDSGDVEKVIEYRQDERIIWMANEPDKLEGVTGDEDKVVYIPDVQLTRISHVKVSLFIALVHGYVGRDETVIGLSGGAHTQHFDTLVLMDAARDLPWFPAEDLRPELQQIATDVLERVIHVALRFATEGYEGRPIGTAFVVGESEELEPYCRQLILNPCKGHPKKSRNINNPEFLDSLREFTALDGAFIVTPKGVVESAGTYLDPPTSRLKLRSGLGARHTAAAALTARTKSVGVVISESSGTVTVYHKGKPLLELQRPEPEWTTDETRRVPSVRKSTRKTTKK